MKSKNDDFRINGESHCLLLGLDGVTYQALLGELSLTGALIKVSDSVPNHLHLGEMCGLKLSGNHNMSSSKYTGVIVELDTGSVGISFNHQAHWHQKN